MGETPLRKQIRLKNYDYSQPGYYFITICIKNREMLLWSDVGATTGRLQLTETGKLIETAIGNIGNIYPDVSVDDYVIMPNHVHLILVIENLDNGRRSVIAPTVTRIIQQFKGYVTKNCKQNNFSWQKSYYEHIIRNEEDLKKIRGYVCENPTKWQEDEYFIR